MIQETESVVTNSLEGGDRQRAMKRLRVPPLGEKQSPWTTFKVGLFSGCFIVLFISVVLSGKIDVEPIVSKTFDLMLFVILFQPFFMLGCLKI